LAHPLQSCVKQLVVVSENEVEPVRGPHVADVDFGCERGEIIGGDLRACAG
jgi:hypothetical protein